MDTERIQGLIDNDRVLEIHTDWGHHDGRGAVGIEFRQNEEVIAVYRGLVPESGQREVNYGEMRGIIVALRLAVEMDARSVILSCDNKMVIDWCNKEKLVFQEPYRMVKYTMEVRKIRNGIENYLIRYCPRDEYTGPHELARSCLESDFSGCEIQIRA